MSKFYCQDFDGGYTLTEEETARKLRKLRNMGLSESEVMAEMFPKTCEKQCFDCMAEVGERRERTNNLLKARKEVKL